MLCSYNRGAGAEGDARMIGMVQNTGVAFGKKTREGDGVTTLSNKQHGQRQKKQREGGR